MHMLYITLFYTEYGLMTVTEKKMIAKIEKWSWKKFKRGREGRGEKTE